MLNSSEYRFLDVGGTFIKRPGIQPVAVLSDGSREEIASALRRAVGKTEGLEGIGVAIPGPFDYREGIFRMDHKFAAVKGESFRALAGIPEGIPVKYIHDVNAILEGAVRMMNLRSGNTALVALGTGLGFSLAINGEVRYGPTLSPADIIWNLPWEDGILEDKVSARGVRDTYVSLGGEKGISVASIAVKAYCGESHALVAFSRMGDALGKALQPLLEQWDVKTLLFAGQISRSLVLMEDALRRHLGKDIKITLAPENAVFEGISSLFENS